MTPLRPKSEGVISAAWQPRYSPRETRRFYQLILTYEFSGRERSLLRESLAAESFAVRIMLESQNDDDLDGEKNLCLRFFELLARDCSSKGPVNTIRMQIRHDDPSGA
jgi:hypothetical protein